VPRVLQVPSGYTHLCADLNYQAPPGVHLSLWRYIAVNVGTNQVGNPCGAPWAYPNSVLVGYAAVRPDRVRYEFSVTGQLLDMSDGSGSELRYNYGALGPTDVWEPRGCAGAPSTCRGLHFTYSATSPSTCPTDPAYSTGSVTCVTDPGGRTVRYVFDAANPKHLMKVVTLGHANTDGTTNTLATQTYTYQGVAGANCSGSANQLCSASDPRTDPGNHTTNFSYTGGQLNLLDPTQSGFEDGTNNTTPLANALAYRSTAQAADSSSASLALKALAAGAMDATTPLSTSGFPVTAGQTYTLRGAFRPETTARSVTVDACFYNATGTYLGCNGPTDTEQAGGWKVVTGTVVAPAGATHAAVVDIVASAAANEIHYVDSLAMLSPLAAPARVASLTDRRGTLTSFAYDDVNSASTSSIANGSAGNGEATRFNSIDASGRVGEQQGTDDAAPANMKHDALSTWDRPNAGCRLPDGTYQSETSGTTAADSSGNGRNASYVGGVTLGQPGAISHDPNDPNPANTAVHFDGSTASVQVANPTPFDMDTATPMSIEAWVQTTTTGIGTIVSKMSNAAPNRGYELLINAGTIRFYKVNDWNANNRLVMNGTRMINDGGWHHVVLTSANNHAAGVTLYIDGVPDPLSTGADTLTGTTLTTAPLWFGSRSPGAWWFPGSLDEVAVYPSVLPPDRVATHFSGGPVDNLLCHVVRRALPGATTPDEDTAYTYDPEGGTLIEARKNGSAGTTYTTNGYHAQYVQSDTSSPTLVDDHVAGGGVVTTGARPAGSATGQTRFYVLDKTESLTARGNDPSAAGATCKDTAGNSKTGYFCYKTANVVDNTANADPNSYLVGGVAVGSCGSAPARNTGDVCEVSAPAFDATGTPTRTAYAYDSFGQKTSMTTPKSFAEASGSKQYTYVYYADTDLDLSGSVSAGGWLKEVVDPTNHFVAFGYDRGGNVARTWDRDATKDNAQTDFPGTLVTPPRKPNAGPVLPFTEVLHGCRSGATNGRATIRSAT
jgi:hypothetical protein